MVLLTKQKIIPVILCGSSGTRLRSLSRKSFPKQFVPLIDHKSLLQMAPEWVAKVNRDGVPPEVMCVAAANHRFRLGDAVQVPEIKSCIPLVPCALDGAPAITAQSTQRRTL